MDGNETATTELEARLRTHYKSVYSEPGTSGTMWEGIARRLGGQEGRESVEFARSVDALYKPGAAGEDQAARVIGRRSGLDVKQRPTFLQPTWRPALAAGLVLALVSTLAVVMMLTNQRADRTLPITTPGVVLEQYDLKNPGFEDGLAAWIKSSQPYQTNFAIDVDKTVVHSGGASALIKSNREDAKGNGMLSWSIDGVAYQGKRVRWTGYLKSETITTDAAEGRAGLWMNVSGTMPGFDPGQTTTLALDNMMDRPVIGTTDWQRYEVVLDVPTGAERIAFGAALEGPGKVWVDDVRLEVVSAEVPSTEYFRGRGTQFENPDFENGLAGWHMYSQWFSAYEAGIDRDVKHGGEASGHLKSVQSNVVVPGELGQKIRADEYRGQRVRLTMFIKTAGIEKGAGFGMGTLLPDGSQGPYDDMATRMISGTNDWQQYHVVIDVPEDATTITMGIVLYGPGQMWVDDLQVEVVGQDVPLTSPHP